VSLLLGQGYNAFVVSGYASREQVFCDLTKITCPYLPEKEEEAEETPPPTTDVPENCKYRLKPALTFKSQFLQGLEDLEEKRKELELRYKEEERQKMIAVGMSRSPKDLLHNSVFIRIPIQIQTPTGIRFLWWH